ncbi:accessory factor UbiK family protein [Basilea psittacipulmonis]|uniref:Phosphoheptose isomerase n=1 Tax=Basilea psittacipulmonis DSM 24701 TaxID=1072685 RepID=A0A077DE75_9BURK|nr:accessory factor UbiK family protein [Basilea psittacipulmonis]AIL32456.1 phosphoheptose isomerase [Basilea psittacipulmonis DSM 24701]
MSSPFDMIQKNVQDLISNTPIEDIQNNVKSIVSQALSKLDLVTRDEFNTQVELVKDLQERVEALEAKLQENE